MSEARRLLVSALAAYRSALRRGEGETEELRAMAHRAFRASKDERTEEEKPFVTDEECRATTGTARQLIRPREDGGRA